MSNESEEERKRRIAEIVQARIDDFQRKLAFVGGHPADIAKVQKQYVNASGRSVGDEYTIGQTGSGNGRRYRTNKGKSF